MKKFLLSVLFFMLLIPMFVNAETCDTDKITISSITLEGKSDSVEELATATASGKNINLNLSMSKVGDNIEYKFVVENNSNKDYELDKTNLNLNSEYINYSFKTDDNSNVVKAKSSKNVTLRIEYKTEVPEDILESGSYNDNKTLTVQLSNGEIDTLKNPNTGVQSYILILIIVLLVSGSLYIVLKKKNFTKLMILIIGTIVVIPISVYAICKCEIKINSVVKISKKNGIEYIKDNSFQCGLVEDEHNELRFVGNNPCNYIMFNNELWRIIGIFDTKSGTENITKKSIKIIRNESIGDYSWDTSKNSYSEEEPDSMYINGYNEWSEADLMNELNGDYLNPNIVEDVYWYNGIADTKTGYFNKSLAIKEEYQEYIETVVWYLGGVDISKDRNSIYYMERSDANCEKANNCDFGIPFVHRTSQWLGKIGLIYYSDYLYSEGWMDAMNLGRTISPYDGANFVADINRNTIYPFCSAPSPVNPSLYLKQNITITGKGTINEPYIIN